MESEELITKVTREIHREDGSQAKIVATAMFGAGLHRSIDVYVLRRESPEHEWQLCNDRPKPGWKEMPLDEYKKNGRSEMLQTVSTGEILKVTNLIGKPMSYLAELEAREAPTARARPRP